MAFTPYQYMKANPPLMWLPADAGTLTVGLAMVYSSGKLVPVSNGVGQDTDEGTHFICQMQGTVAAGQLIPVMKVDANIIWETTIGALSGTAAVGGIYTLHTDGESITDATTKGVFHVTYLEDGANTGTIARGYIID